MATTLAWTESFSVGVKGIDRQHRELLTLVNALFDAIGSGQAGRDVEELIVYVENHVHHHFLCEERLMRGHGYPGYALHLSHHQHFVEELARIEELSGRSGLSPELVARMAGYITDWLSEHFVGDDLRLAEYLRAQGARLHPSTRAA